MIYDLQTPTLNPEAENNEVYKKVNSLLSSKYEAGYQFGTMTYKIVDENQNEISFPEDAEYSIPVYSIWSKELKVFKYENDSLTEIKSVVQDDENDPDFYTMTLNDLSGTYVMVAGTEKVPHGPAYGEIEAGTYTVSANMYIKGEDNTILPGTTAYMTNPNVPPVTAMKNNAKMKVDEEGNVTVSINLPNIVFTLQQIEDGTDVHILKDQSEYGAGDGTTEEQWIQATNGLYKGRYLDLTVSIDNMNGEYLFTNCKEYPTILNETKEFPIYLGIDFKDIKKEIDTDGKDVYVKTYKDKESGISLEVKTTESDLKEKLEKANLRVTTVTEEAAEKIKKNVLEYYQEMPELSIYDLELEDETGKNIEFTGNTSVVMYFETKYDDMSIYKIDDSQNISVSGAVKKDNQYQIEWAELGTYVICNNEGTANYIINRLEDSDTGAAITAYATSRWSHFMSQWTIVSEKTSLGEVGNKWRIVPTSDDKKSVSSSYISKYKFEIPLENEDNSLYLITEEKSGSRICKKLNTEYKDGKAIFELYSQDGDNVRDWNEIQGLWNEWSGNKIADNCPQIKTYIIETKKNCWVIN